jgi:hypothetical protein
MANIAFLGWPIWERAVSGHVVADPAMTLMKSRRIACPPKGLAPCRLAARLQQEFAPNGTPLRLQSPPSTPGALTSVSASRADIYRTSQHFRDVPLGDIAAPVPAEAARHKNLDMLVSLAREVAAS